MCWTGIDPDRNGRIEFNEFWNLICGPITNAIQLLQSHFEFQRQAEEPTLTDVHKTLSKIYSTESIHSEQKGRKALEKRSSEVDSDNDSDRDHGKDDDSSEEEYGEDVREMDETFTEANLLDESKSTQKLLIDDNDEYVEEDDRTVSKSELKKLNSPAEESRPVRRPSEVQTMRSFGVSNTLTYQGSFRKQSSEVTFEFERNPLGKDSQGENHPSDDSSPKLLQKILSGRFDRANYRGSSKNASTDARPSARPQGSGIRPSFSKAYSESHGESRESQRNRRESRRGFETPATPRGNYKSLDDFFSAMTN